MSTEILEGIPSPAKKRGSASKPVKTSDSRRGGLLTRGLSSSSSSAALEEPASAIAARKVFLRKAVPHGSMGFILKYSEVLKRKVELDCGSTETDQVLLSVELVT